MSTLYPYQIEGKDFLRSRVSGFLADEPGLGKTVQTITAARELGCDPRKTLIVCPKSARGVWAREWARWWPGSDLPVIINYDLISAQDPKPEVKGLFGAGWDLLVADEAHRLKSHGANRTKSFYTRLAPNAGRVWLLSGTPVPNHNGELWTHLYHLQPGLIDGMRRKAFEDRYCRVSNHPRWGRRIAGSARTGELRERIKPFVFRRTKAEVLGDLPALTFDTVELPPTDMARAQESQLPGLTGLPSDPDELMQALRSQETALATERRITGALKVAPSVDLIAEYLMDNPSEKVLVFAHHREVLNGLDRGLTGEGLVRIDGSTSAGERERAVDGFQNGKARVFLGQISACGEALTLTAGSRVFFVECSWTPSENHQAACRAHRIGQKSSVFAQFLTLPDSIDGVIAEVLARKTKEVAELFG